MGKYVKTAIFSGRLWPDWGNTTWAAMAGLGSIGLTPKIEVFLTPNMNRDLCCHRDARSDRGQGRGQGQGRNLDTVGNL